MNTRAQRTTVGATAKQRILGAADELFYTEGVHTVGIDRVIEHAGVAKASLYRLFGSKENLVGSYLAGRREGRLSDMRRAAGACDDPREAILAIFDLEAQWLSSPSFRGCPFARAIAESPAGSRAHEETAAYRGAIFDLFKNLAVDAGADDPDLLATQLHTLYHGTETVFIGSHGDEVIAATRTAVKTLVHAACTGRRP